MFSSDNQYPLREGIYAIEFRVFFFSPPRPASYANSSQPHPQPIALAKRALARAMAAAIAKKLVPSLGSQHRARTLQQNRTPYSRKHACPTTKPGENRSILLLTLKYCCINNATVPPRPPPATTAGKAC